MYPEQCEQAKRIEMKTDKNEYGASLGTKKVQVIPIVIHALGMISIKLETWLEKIGVNKRTEILQKSTLLGTARILRRNLEM